jgi:hypothetical protein
VKLQVESQKVYGYFSEHFYDTPLRAHVLLPEKRCGGRDKDYQGDETFGDISVSSAT